jgi:pimeloyl-ACP methyl ester carboxylesterase
MKTPSIRLRVFLPLLTACAALNFSRAADAPPADAAAIPGKGLAGHWLGVLAPAPGVELRLAMEVTEPSPGKPEGVLISLDQGAARLPLTAINEHDGAVLLEVKRVGGSFDGVFRNDGAELAGTWKQGSGALPLVFKRTTGPVTINRPQEPKKPYPYAEEEVIVENKTAGLKLAGTLTLPSGAGPHPAVVLITGSGPQDRDETVASHRPFLVLADHLTRNGIAVLRCDDRGTGKSGGKFSPAIEPDFVEDAQAMVAFLRGRPEIDAKRIGLLGHSEGGCIAPRVATKSSDIAFIVLLAAPGVPLGEIVIRQGADISRTRGLSEERIAANVAMLRDAFGILRAEKDPAAAERALRQMVAERTQSMNDKEKAAADLSSQRVDQQIKGVLSPWFRDLIDYDPRPALQAVQCPVLALNGEKDLQVAAKVNLPVIRDALKAGGNPRAKIVELPGLNHLFQTCQTGAPAEYSRIEETFNPAALTLISDWIHEVAAR